VEVGDQRRGISVTETLCLRITLLHLERGRSPVPMRQARVLPHTAGKVLTNPFLRAILGKFTLPTSLTLKWSDIDSPAPPLCSRHCLPLPSWTLTASSSFLGSQPLVTLR
jgi:hypothetical protein